MKHSLAESMDEIQQHVHNMDESQRNDTERKKSGPKRCIHQNSIYIKYKNWQS